jgi:hypothetical protein
MYIWTYICIQVNTKCAYICIQVHTKCAYICIHLHTKLYIYIHMHTCTYIQSVPTYVYIYIKLYTCTYIQMYTCNNLTALFVPPTQYLLFKFVRPNPIRFFGAAFFPIPEIRTLGLRIQGIGDLLSCVRIRSTFPHSSTATLNRFFCLFFRGKKVSRLHL